VRLVLEASLLVALAVVLGLADVRPLAIVLAMGLAWLIVAIVEWIALREVPHYGSGSHPRYELPAAPLPPPHPIEQVAPYPTAREIDAPTWIASAAQTEAGVGEWPVPAVPYEAAVPVAVEPELERDEDDEPDVEEAPAFAPPGAGADPWYVQELPAEPLAGAPQARPALHRVDPLAVPAERGLFRRRSDAPASPVVEFPVLPRHAPLPARRR